LLSKSCGLSSTIRKENVSMVEASIARVNSLSKVSRGSAPVVGVSLTILPDTTKFVFRGRATSLFPAGEAFGVDLPQIANRFNRAGGRKAYWLGPDEWLLDAADEDPGELFSRMSEKLGGHSCSLVDVSHRSDALSLSGPKSGYVLNHGCPLDLCEQQFPVGMCTRTVLGKSSILLSRPDRDVFQIDVWRSFSSYVWSLLDEARQEFSSDQT
jgi:sarcosine oxidase, subunit gamma